MNNIKFLFVIPLVFFLSYCGHNKEEKQNINAYKKQGEINAISYIEKKYQFTPKILKTKAVTEAPYMIPDLFTPPTGTVLIEASYNNKKFNIRILGNKVTDSGSDDYQYDEIVNDVLRIIKEDTKVEPHYYHISYGVYDDSNLIEEYYNKDNLKEITNNIYFNVVLEYINNSYLINNDYKNTLKYFNNRQAIGIANYKSLETYKKRYQLNDKFSLTILRKYIDSNRLYLNSMSIVGHDGLQHISTKVVEYDNLFFYGDNSITITKSTIDDAKNWIGRGAINPKQISEAYSIKTNSDSIYVYFPNNIINNYDLSKVLVGVECVYNGEKKYKKESGLHFDQTKDYFHTHISLYNCNNEIKITLFYDN